MAFVSGICVFSILICFFVMVSAAIAAMQTMSRDTMQVFSFDVKPGAGSQQMSQNMEEFRCTFDYKAQGGTKEEWAMTLTKDAAAREWLCTVERPSGHSYLFFEEFKLQITGAQLEETLLEMPRYYSLKDVAEHGTADSPWFIIKGKVYDVTKLLTEHPGGDKVLLQFAGKDATGGFFGRQHSDSAKKWMKDFEIGELGDKPKPWWKSPLCIAGGVAVVAVAAVGVYKLVKHNQHTQ